MKKTDGARWTYEAEDENRIRLVPELVMLGSHEVRKAIPLGDHEHPGCYEFVFIERGKANWELNGSRYETHAGDVFYSRPGEWHRGGFNVIEPCKFWWLIIKAPHHEGWLQLAPEESIWLENALAELPRVIHTGLQPVESFTSIRKGIMTESPSRSMIIRKAILDLLLHMIQRDSNKQPIADDLLRQFDKLMEKMNREPEWRPSVQQLADAANVSASHFYRTFQLYTGQPPMTYMERIRAKEACRLLQETNRSVTEITYLLGYQSSQHFATVFKRFMGVTPTQWRSQG